MPILDLLKENHGDVFQGHRDAGHWNVPKEIFISRNQKMNLCSGLSLRFNEYVNGRRRVLVSLVFKKDHFTNDTLTSIYRLYDGRCTNTFLDDGQNNGANEFRIYWKYYLTENSIDSDVVEWMYNKALDILDLLPDNYYEMIPR